MLLKHSWGPQCDNQDAISLCISNASPVGRSVGVSQVRLGSEGPVPLHQRSQFLQLLLLGAFQILEPPSQQRKLPLMLLLWYVGEWPFRPQEEEGGR